MKIPLLLLAILVSASVFSQDSTLRKKYRLRAIIRHEGNKPTTRAFLADINDTAVLLMQTPTSFRAVNNASTTAVPYYQIKVITVYRKGSVGRGMLYGTIAGTVLGGVTGAALAPHCHDCKHGTSGLIVVGSSMIGATTGFLIGTFVGSISRKMFEIGGRKDRFQRMKMNVLDRAYSK